MARYPPDVKRFNPSLIALRYGLGMRILIALVVVAAAALVALWQLNVIDMPFGGPSEAEQAQLNLFEAVRAGDVATLQERVAGGADVNARDAFGQTPLMYAVGENGSLEVAQALLATGADPNARTEAGWTALMYATRAGWSPSLGASGRRVATLPRI